MNIPAKHLIKNSVLKFDSFGATFNLFRRARSLLSEAKKRLIIDIKAPYVRRRHVNKIRKMQGTKDKVRVAFLVRHASQWKYEDLYQVFEDSNAYMPFVVVLPDFENHIWEHEYRLALKRFSSDDYKMVSAFDMHQHRLIKPAELNADIVFFPKPLQGRDPFSIEKFTRSLTCYVPYSTYGDNNMKLQYDRVFHNLLWRHYVATEIHHNMAFKVARNKGKNIQVVGYPACDVFLRTPEVSAQTKDGWKKAGTRKKIIWAPHHTIYNSKTYTNHSNFLRLSDAMLNLAKKYKESVHIAFKPHPNLRRHLAEFEGWGREKTEQYYQQWNHLENGQLEEGDYLPLFIDSDAMIHDSVSFMAEYLYTLNPTCYVVKDHEQVDMFLNEFGKKTLDLHELVYSIDDIEKFILSIVEGKKDKKYCAKRDFVNNVLLPPNRKFAFENIFLNIDMSVKGKL